jgi:hypothetical protein
MLVVLASVGLGSLLAKLQVNDLAYQLRVGQWMRAVGAIARTDTLTFTMYGQPWLNQQWGSQILLSTVYSVGGWRSLILLRALLVVGCFGAVYRLARSNGAFPVIAAICTLAGYMACALVPGTLALRPQSLALPLLLISAWAIWSRDSHPRRLYFLPLIGVIWANLHGSFPLLTILLVIALVDDVARRVPSWKTTAVFAAVSVLTPLLSPFGFGTYRYVWLVSTSPFVRTQISEWQPLYANGPAGLAFLALVAVGCWLAARHITRRPTVEEALTLLTFSLLAIWSSRNILWWGVLVPVVVGGMLAGRIIGSGWSRRAMTLVSTMLALAIAIAVVSVATQPISSLLSEAPTGVADALATIEPVDGRVFDEWWGSWLEFAVPERQVFTDARVELFPDQVWVDYGTVVSADPGWRDVLDRWEISAIVVDRAHSVPLLDALADDPDWSLVYEDGDGVIFQRVMVRDADQGT